jgi:hypothetical protein
MSNIVDFFKSLNVQLEVSNESYVYYDADTGKIVKISNRKTADSEYSVLEVSHDQVKDILEGRRNTNDFIVTYDLSVKQLALKEVTYETEIESVSSLLHRLKITHDFYDPENPVKERVYEEIYDGVTVYIWIPHQSYVKNSLVWFDNNVYKLKTNINSKEFDLNNAELYVESVNLTDEKIILSDIVVDEYKKEYEGIFVDVWYKELGHLKGQHVWYNNTVYKYINDQPKDTAFNYKSVEVVVSDVKLYNDDNKSLDFSEISQGDLFLDCNQLYSYKTSVSESVLENKNIVFYVSEHEFLVYDSSTKKFIKASILEKDNVKEVSYETIGIELPITTVSFFNKGDKILLGKNLVQLSDIDADIIVIQNKKTKDWSIRLSNSTKKFLQTSGYNANDRLYFSITEKYDPNILIRTLDFSLSSLLNDKTQTYKFESPKEETDEVSVYTTQFFKLYTHEVLS